MKTNNVGTVTIKIILQCKRTVQIIDNTATKQFMCHKGGPVSDYQNFTILYNRHIIKGFDRYARG